MREMKVFFGYGEVKNPLFGSEDCPALNSPEICGLKIESLKSLIEDELVIFNPFIDLEKVLGNVKCIEKYVTKVNTPIYLNKEISNQLTPVAHYFVSKGIEVEDIPMSYTVNAPFHGGGYAYENGLGLFIKDGRSVVLYINPKEYPRKSVCMFNTDNSNIDYVNYNNVNYKDFDYIEMSGSVISDSKIPGLKQGDHCSVYHKKENKDVPSFLRNLFSRLQEEMDEEAESYMI